MPPRRAIEPDSSPQQAGELLAELRHLGRDDHLAIALPRVDAEVALMVLLRLVETLERHHLRDDWPWPEARGAQFGDDGLGGRLLLRRVVEDGRSVLRADVGALAVERGRVVDGEEDLQELF